MVVDVVVGSVVVAQGVVVGSENNHSRFTTPPEFEFSTTETMRKIRNELLQRNKNW